MIRKLAFVGMLGLISMALLSGNAPIDAQGKKKGDVNKQNQLLKKTIAERDQRIRNLEAQLQRLRVENTGLRKKGPGAGKLQADLNAANQKIQDQEELIDSLKKGDLSAQVAALRKKVRELGLIKNAPLVHTKILKLKKADDKEVKKIEEEAAKTLAKIEGIRAIWIARPAESPTPELAQKGYQIGVMVLLDDAEALQKFLDDPLHKQFTDRLADLWERPVVYDIQRETEDAKKKDEKRKDDK
ncbi:MAG: Dabb family protein [Planctomycetes bacterium]|jgi:hypothetical protein|nr:Dabb family protein [Planctomycetota bacterium]